MKIAAHAKVLATMLLAIYKIIEFLRFSTYKTSITLLSIFHGLTNANPIAKIEKRNEMQ